MMAPRTGNTEAVACRTCVVCCIPAQFSVRDLRRFFGDFVERSRIAAFHYLGTNTAKVARGAVRGPVPEMAPSRGHCCLVRLVTRADVSSFARLYDGTKWVDAKGRVFADECVVLRCTAGAAQDGAVALAPGHKLRLNPVLPQGNVGTPHGTLLDQVARCKLPRRALRELGVECDPEEVSPSFRYSYTTFSPESAAVAVGECRGVEGGVDYFPWLSKPGLDLTLVPSKLLRRRRGHQTPSQSASAPSPASVPAPTPATAPAPAPAPAPPLPAAWTRRTEPRASPDNEQARYEEDEAEWRALRSQDAAPSEAPTARPQPGGAARQGTDGSGGSVRGRGQRRGGRRSWQRWMQGRHARDRVEGLPQAEAAANGAVPVGEDCESDEEEWDRHMALHTEKETTHHFSTRTEERLQMVYEEPVEKVWDKGDASGLVMYTDSFYWEQRRGGFDEKTTDDFDVDPTGEYDRQRYGGGYVERTDGGEDHGRDTEGGGALEGTPCPVFYRDGSRSRKRARPPSITEQKRLFKHTVDRDVGGKLLRRLGWREGQPLGMRRGSEQGTVFPFERAAANRPRGRHGLGFGGGPPTHVAGAEAASSSDSEDGPDLAPSIAERRRQRFADPPLDKAFIGSTYGARRE